MFGDYDIDVVPVLRADLQPRPIEPRNTPTKPYTGG